MWLHEELRNAVVRPRFLCYGKNWVMAAVVKIGRKTVM